MNNSHHQIASTIIEVCKKVEAKGFVAATDGNISIRLENGNILATPTSLNKGLVQIDDLVEVTLEGKRVSGKRNPSTEMQMHYFIYAHRPDVNAVVHCHPIYATGFAAAGIALTPNVFPEVVVQFGNIPLAGYATPSTKEVGESLRAYIKDYDAILLANHGVVSYGKDLWDAYYTMEKVEQIAHMLFVTEMLGGAKKLNDEQINTLKTISENNY